MGDHYQHKQNGIELGKLQARGLVFQVSFTRGSEGSPAGDLQTLLNNVFNMHCR